METRKKVQCNKNPANVGDHKCFSSVIVFHTKSIWRCYLFLRWNNFWFEKHEKNQKPIKCDENKIIATSAKPFDIFISVFVWIESNGISVDKWATVKRYGINEESKRRKQMLNESDLVELDSNIFRSIISGLETWRTKWAAIMWIL